MMQSPDMPLVAGLFPVVALVYVAAGLAAWTRRPKSRLGLLMVFGGGVWLLCGLINVQLPALVAVGMVTRTLGIGVIIHLLVSFPTGRLHTWPERLVVAATYFTCLILEIPIWLFAAEGPLSVADRPDLVRAGLTVLRVAGAVVVLAAAAILIGRMRRMSRNKRHVLAPLTIYGIFAVLLVPVSSEVAHRWFNGGGLTLPVIQLIGVALVPVAFSIAASRGGFARTADIAELGTWLAAENSSRRTLRQALADTLGDPSLQLLFRLPGASSLIDDRGLTVATPEPDPARGVVQIQLDGNAVGAIVYDAVLLDRPDEIREAGRVVALALDRERLVIELLASRSRLVAATDDERRRISLDLHDGLRSRLATLALEAESGADEETLRAGIETAIDELRDLVEDVIPAQLTERGLPAAVDDLADRMPVPIRLDVSGFDRRLKPEVETAAFFIISMAMLNAAKQTDLKTLAVSLDNADGELSIVIADRGNNGTRTGDGDDLRALDDRVAALGGWFEVRSSGNERRVLAVIPCGS